ncbi:MAG: GTPase [Deltaproteobacteria bacterium]|nr:GTPase [Deltaproteobacteria bacterium]
MKRKKLVIMGAAGRDFHNFNVCFRDDPSYDVAAFTATQIPFIQGRVYPPLLSGPLYPEGIPVYPEEELPRIIREHSVDTVVFSYSDVSHEYVMHRASLVIALGADFTLLGADKTMLESVRPVISVCAVRTGAGKSAITRKICRIIKKAGKKAVAIRHPMPYGDILKQRVQRFASVEDMAAAGATIEEMEEYEHLIEAGITVYAGVAYAEILKAAEKEADIIVWDGGNNDLPFIKPGLEIVVTDPMRPGHETLYHPGEANLRRAGVVIINKVNTARPQDVETVRENIRLTNPGARVFETASVITVEGKERLRGKRVLVIEDGPTLTHGGMTFGAGVIAARTSGAVTVDPRPHARGSIKEVFVQYPALHDLLPAMGYRDFQIRELEETINSTPADMVLIATPVDLARLIKINKPAVRVRYDVEDVKSPGLKEAVESFLQSHP